MNPAPAIQHPKKTAEAIGQTQSRHGFGGCGLTPENDGRPNLLAQRVERQCRDDGTSFARSCGDSVCKCFESGGEYFGGVAVGRSVYHQKEE